jgi:hypothetical protein
MGRSTCRTEDRAILTEVCVSLRNRTTHRGLETWSCSWNFISTTVLTMQFNDVLRASRNRPTLVYSRCLNFNHLATSHDILLQQALPGGQVHLPRSLEFLYTTQNKNTDSNTSVVPQHPIDTAPGVTLLSNVS